MSHLIKIYTICNLLFSFLVVNPFALRKAKTVCNFGLSECTRVKELRKDLILISYRREISK